jgi:GNAT superfamily N-acetyltransferase
VLSQPATSEEIVAVRALMLEYQALLGVDLCFQGFNAEVRDLPGSYAPRRGRLLLATRGGSAIGCVALHAAGWPRAEMKRLFVRPSGRGLGVGRGRELGAHRAGGLGQTAQGPRGPPRAFMRVAAAFWPARRINAGGWQQALSNQAFARNAAGFDDMSSFLSNENMFR